MIAYIEGSEKVQRIWEKERFYIDILPKKDYIICVPEKGHATG